MITRLRLTNWRAYENLDLDLPGGTTFIVAPNGVGKTSLVEAAGWALFGDHLPPPLAPVRAGADKATALVEVLLPDSRILRVERTHTRRPMRKAPEPSVHVDGGSVPADSLDGLLRKAYGADASFLARIAMPGASAQLALPDGRGLREHLCRLFGIENLSNALSEIDARLRDSEKAIKAAKQGQRVDQSRLESLRVFAESTAADAESARIAHARARLAVEAEVKREHARELTRQWQHRNEQRQTVLTQVASEAAAVIGHHPEPHRVAEALADATSRTRDELALVLRSLGANDAALAAVEAASRGLTDADADCPVCRRPLDEHTIETARAAHDREVRELRLTGSRLANTETQLRSTLVALDRLSAAVAAAPADEPRPAVEDLEVGDGTAQPSDGLSERLRAEEAAALNAFVRARAAADNANRALEQALQDEGAHEHLVALFAANAVLRGARSTIDRTVRTFVEETVGPVAAELGPRWAELFPGREGVVFDGEGNITRPVNGQELSFESFSGGERIGALVLIRLLIAQMTTKATFCWFDEPLEHLDPDTRRQVSSLLVGAGSSRPLRQVVLTTYEEPLAARLAADMPSRVNLVAVRSSGSATS